MEFLYFFLFGAAISALATAAAIWGFPRIGLLDFPHRYGLRRPRKPYPGGLIFLLLALGVAAFWPEFSVLFWPILALGILSFVDDRRPLPALFRGTIHLLIAASLFWAGVRIEFLGNPFAATNFALESFPIFQFLLTVFWVVLIQNALNFFDGISGSTVGVSGVGFLILAMLGVVRPELFFDPNHADLTAANFFFAGAAAGAFFWFWRGKIILGDTGSQILGFLLAALSIFSGAKIATTLLVLGLPILDAFFVIFRRIFWEKTSPFRGDFRHLPHNLARKIGEKNTTLFLVFASATFGAIGLFSQSFFKLLALAFVFPLIFSLQIWATKNFSK